MKKNFPEFLGGGKVVEKAWVGCGVALVFVGIFWEFFGGRKRGRQLSVYTYPGARSIYLSARTSGFRSTVNGQRSALTLLCR
jgi:hypothetical protein